MPYCVQCGQTVGRLGQILRQVRHPSSLAEPPELLQADLADRLPAPTGCRISGANISHRNAALLCYIPWVGWIAAIAVLASERFRAEKRLRFHAFQGLYLFAAWLMVEWVIAPMLTYPVPAAGFPFYRTISQILHLLIVGAWIFMLMKVSHDEDYRLPILGELADRSVSEQRP